MGLEWVAIPLLIMKLREGAESRRNPPHVQVPNIRCKGVSGKREKAL